MEFRILGPLEVRSGTGVVPLPRRRERVLLAALLLHPREVVSTDRLIEAIWGETPPRTATGSLQNAVLSLRKLLGAETIRLQPPGYVLDVEPDAIDASRFERLLDEAMRAEDAERAELLASALALWRGPALADVADEDVARNEAARLDDLRLVAVEERIDADLGLGRDAELIPELEAHVSAYPLRERATRQLMLALYRAGRQAESLEAYQRARRALDGVGIVPAPELQELQREILQQDPRLLLPKDRPAGAATVVAPEAARKTVTILAATLAAADGLDPEALRPLLETWLATIRELVGRHGGTLDRYLGTEAVAVFGVPTTHEDDALRAVRSAIDLREEYAARPPTPRIGIATGEALVGVGTAPVVGDVVAVAAALRDGAPPGVVLASDATLELVRDAVSTGERREIAVGDRVLTGVEIAAAQGAHGRLRRLDAPLVGRDPALEKLRDALGRASSDERCIPVAVVGEAGIGKTRLARELMATVPHAQVLTAACAPYGEDASYGPVLDLVRQAAGEVTVEAISSLLEPADDRVAHDLASIATDAPAPRGDVFLAVRALLAALASRRPVVVVLDDVHWADATLLDLVEYLGDRVTGPVLLVCLARPELLETRPEWGDGTGRITLGRLGPLTTEAARTALEAMSNEVDQATVERIVERAAGNPLHLEQLHAYAAEGGDPGAVPATIEAVLAQRLDRLDRTQLDVLRRSAVLGESPSRDGVLALADDRDAVDPALLALVRRGLLHPEPSASVDDAYTFHHALLRDVAYGGLTKEARARLHAQAAAWIDRDGDGFDEVVGYHLEHSHRYRSELGSPDDELSALGEAAGARLAAAAWREWRGSNVPAAIDLYGRAISVVPDASPARADLTYELAIALNVGGRQTESNVWLEEALATARRLGLASIEARARVEQERRRLTTGDSSPGALEEVARAAIPVLEAAGDRRGLARSWAALDAAANFSGHYREAIAAAEQALDHYRASGYSPATPIVAITSAMFFGSTATDEALLRCEALREGADRASEAAIASAIGLFQALRGDFDAADVGLSQSEELWDLLGMRRSSLTMALERRMILARLRGDIRAAEAVGRQRLKIYAESGERPWESTAAVQLAWVLLDRGEVAEAAQLVEHADARAHPHDVLVQSLVKALRGRLHARHGDHAGAFESAHGAVEVLADTDGVVDLAVAWAARSEVERLAGQGHEASASAARAEELCREKGAPALWASLAGVIAGP